MEQTKIKHPVAIGTKTNIGTISSYKYVRFGISKYRYFVKETNNDYGQEDILELL